MKKLTTLLLALVACAGTMFASDTSVDGIWYNFDDEHLTAEVTYRGDSPFNYENIYSGEVVISSSVTYNNKTYTVTSIGDEAFAGCSGLTSVTIPNSVTSIGNNAFHNCGLTSVTIPSSVTSIGLGAFYQCTGLTTVTIPNSVTSIGEEAFTGCSSLTAIDVAADNPNYSSLDGVIFNKDKTTLVAYPGGKQGTYSIPNSVTSIGEYAFYQCTGLTSVTIGNSVTSIGDWAFSGCSNLTSVTIPNSVTTIGEWAFDSCSSLTSVTIPNSVTSIGWGALSKCSSLTSVTIPNSVTSIGEFAFSWCTGLTSVTIPNSVTTIGDWAFRGCTDLTSVTNYATTPQSINSNVFTDVNRSTCVLNVPKESVSLYQAAEVWKEFTNIVGVDVPKDTSVGGIWYNFDDEHLTAEVTYSGDSPFNYENIYSGEVVIPSSVTYNNKTYTVTSIGDEAFAGCTGLTSVEIPNSVTSIGNNAFHNCGLTSVTIPSSVTSIGLGAFYQCTGLTSVTIPNSVTSIGEEAFTGCSSLTAIDVAADNPNYSSLDGVLFNKDKTTLVAYPGGKQGTYSIPNSVTSIGEYAFYQCTGLTSVTIGNSVTSIGDWAFSGCSNLTSVTIPNSVTTIGEWAFDSCSSLTSVTIPNSVTSIGWGAFSKCSSLTSVTIPNSVTSIGEFAFSWCTGLTTVTIPNSVTFIGDWAFRNCSNLTSVTNYATTPQSINSNVFNNVDKSNCTLNVPKESVSLYQAAEVWKEFTNIVGVDVPKDNSVDGIWYNFNNEHLTAEVTYQGDAYDTYSNEYSGEVVIPSSVTYNAQTYTVTSIGERAFYDCSGLTSLTIPNSVTSIGDGAFYGCSGLTSLTIPNSVTSIGDQAFRECSGLTSVTIPNSVTSIGRYAFYECYGLTSVTIPNSVTSIGNGTFEGCSGLTSVTIPNSVTSIGEWAFFGCSGLTSVTIPNSVTSIGDVAFEGCFGLTSVTIGNSVNSIGDYAFSECSGLTSVMISDMAGWCAIRFGNYYGNPLYYADNLYLNGTLVTNLVIPEGVTNIGNYAFDGFSGIISVTIPNSVTSIGEYAFGYCSGLTSVTIPNSVTSIGREAFRECTGLTSVTNYATTPQSIISNVFEYVNKSTCILNVPKKSVSLYQAAEVWKEFTNIVGVDVPGEDPEIETVEGDYTIYYVDKESQDLSDEVVSLHVPVAPAIEGFTFIGWDVVAGHLTDGITLQAVYQANTPTSAPAVYTNPANPAQKLIRNGNVYILTDDKTYSIDGRQVK